MQQLNTVLAANNYSELSDDIKKLIPDDFEQYVAQQFSLDDIDPNITRIIETGETSTILLDVECSLIALIHMSSLTVGLTFGVTALLMGVLAVLIYYYRQKSAKKNRQLLLDNFKLAFLQAQGQNQIALTNNKQLDLTLLTQATLNSQPKTSIKSQTVYIAKKTSVVVAANIGTALVLGWGLPAILSALGVSAGIASLATPAGIAVIGILALGLTGYAMYKMYRRYQATQKYQATLQYLTQSKLTFFQHSDTTDSVGKQGSINTAQLAQQ